MDKKDALQILGLSENDGKDKIEARYENLIRRLRNGEELDQENIDRAFDVLMDREIIVVKQSKFARFYKKLMFDFFGWIVLSVIAIGVLASILIPIATKRVPDLTISFTGKYSDKDLDTLDEYLQQRMPETEDILVETMYIDKEGESGEFGSGGVTRLMALLMTDDADILISDDSTFNLIRQEDALMILDDVIDTSGLDIDPDRFIYGIDFTTGEKRVFGILVSVNDLIKDGIYGADIRILCIAKRTRHFDAVVKAAEIILNDRSE